MYHENIPVEEEKNSLEKPTENRRTITVTSASRAGYMTKASYRVLN